jgi:hypothetical protein
MSVDESARFVLHQRIIIDAHQTNSVVRRVLFKINRVSRPLETNIWQLLATRISLFSVLDSEPRREERGTGAWHIGGNR